MRSVIVLCGIALVSFGTDAIAKVVKCRGGLITATIGTNSATFVDPDSGSDATVYSGSQNIVAIAACGRGGSKGVVTAFSQGGIYYSPDCYNIGGGGETTLQYPAGKQQVVDMSTSRDGVKTRFSGGGEYYSPDCMNIGGGGNTTRN